jgi:hypothetical protein
LKTFFEGKHQNQPFAVSRRPFWRKTPKSTLCSFSKTFLKETPKSNLCSFSKTYLKENTKIKPLQFLEDIFEGNTKNQTVAFSRRRSGTSLSRGGWGLTAC